MSNISGEDNEFSFVKYLNGKKVGELNPLFRDLIDSLFYCKEDDIIKCWRNHFPQKSDIFIKINGKLKGISIKKGAKNSIHVERITDFIHFLIENKVSREVVVRYLEYHYADGTRNGKGLNRISVEEYKKSHSDDILYINEAFNNKKLLIKAIDKFVVRGNNSKYDIDALIYGEVDDFLWITKDDIRRIIMSKKDLNSSGLHFGSLSCQPKTRNLNCNPKYEKDRFCVQLKWFSLFDDIIEYKNNLVMQKIKT